MQECAPTRGEAGLSLLSYFCGMNSVASQKFKGRTQLSAFLMAGTMLAWPAAGVQAQTGTPPTLPAPVPDEDDDMSFLL